MEAVGQGIVHLIEGLELGTNFIGKHMKKILLVILIICAFYWWPEFGTFVSTNAAAAKQHISAWLVEHTPKK